MSKWVEQLFKAQAAQNGGVIRRKRKSVEQFASVAELEAAVKKRNFHLVEVGDQLIVLCNKGQLKVIC